MSGLFKAGDARIPEAVRLLSEASAATHLSKSAPVHSDIPEPSEVLNRKCIELEGTITDLRHRIAQMETEAEQREEGAFERGRQDGLDHAAGEEKRRLNLLSASLEKLQRNNPQILADCEILALQLSRTALKRIFGDETLQADLLHATLSHHLSALQTDMVRQVRVSARDFQSSDALIALGQHYPGLTVMSDETLAPGDCVADLRLGSLEIGLAGQWHRLCVFFDQLAEEEMGAMS